MEDYPPFRPVNQYLFFIGSMKYSIGNTCTMNKLIFGTTNEGKLTEARQILEGIEIEGVSLDFPEIQSLDLTEIALEKSRNYFSELKQPVFVEDQGLYFKSLGGLPGPYIKDFLKSIGPEGLCKILDPFPSRDVIAQTIIAYSDQNGGVHIFDGKIQGTIAKTPKGDRGFGWDFIFIPEGETKTFAQMTAPEKNKISMRAIALGKFKKWLNEQI